MQELRLTDLELQRLLAPALKKRLRQEGFRFGAPSLPDDDTPQLLMLPVNLDLAEDVAVERTSEGVWLFRQVDPTIDRRFAETYQMHAEAIGKQHLKPGGEP